MPTTIDLSTLGHAGIVISGPYGYSQISNPASAGDFNGDGIADFLITSPFTGPQSTMGGTIYLIFGRAVGFGALDLSNLTPDQGFAIHQPVNSPGTSSVASSAGDVNGDGYDDIVIGQPHYSEHGYRGGQAYIVYGGAEHYNSLNLRTMTSAQGATISFISSTTNGAGIYFGQSVSNAGDINGDGFDDVIIGAPGDSTATRNAGRAFVLYGSQNGIDNINILNILPEQGFSLTGTQGEGFSGSEVTSLGDINGDGIDDFAVAAANESGYSGNVYILYGKEGGLSSRRIGNILPEDGFVIRGVTSGRGLGQAISDAGDINADGYEDFIVSRGTYGTFVIFGKADNRDTINIDNLSSEDGFRIDYGSIGGGYMQVAGADVSGAGDVNGDGYDDILISVSDHFGYGSAYIIYGGPGINSATLGVSEGLIIKSGERSDQFALSTAIVEDVNGDGAADILLGAPASHTSGYYSGLTYLIYGVLPSNAVELTGTIAGQTLVGGASADVLDGRGGDDRLYGNDGDDKLWGGDGDDWLQGGAGADELIGGLGNDVYFVDSLDDIVIENAYGGIDELRTSIAGYALPNHFENLTYTGTANSSFAGSAANNVMTGSIGNDAFDGRGGDDTLSGGGGDDTLQGGDGDDILNGGDGDDLLIAGTGADTLRGGAGNDRYWITDARAQITETDGAGSDELSLGVSYVLSAGISIEFVNLSLRPASHIANDLAIDFTGNEFAQRIDATDGINVIHGGGGGDTIRGFGGDDILFGDSGDDELLGGTGADYLDGGAGNDTISGGDGDDTIVVTPGEDTVDGGAGTDTMIVHVRDIGLIPALPAGYSFTVTATNLRDESGTIDTDFTGIERIVFSTEVVSGGGTRAPGVLYVNGSAATVALTISNMGPYADVLRGGSGDDVFNLNRSAGAIDGGGGLDIVNLSAEPAYTYTLTDTGSGGVFVRTNDLAIPYTATLTNIETIYVPGTTINASASAFDGYVFLDLSYAGIINDVSFRQQISGSRGDDRFLTTSGADSGGNDDYRGNGGQDVFDFRGALGRIGHKTIGDFDGDDRIDVSGGGVFIGTAAFSGVAGQVRYTAANGQTVIQIDANGDGTADQTITLDSGAYVLGETAVGSAVLRIATPQNVVDGTNADDNLIGTSGDDLVRGVNGNDTIRATTGTDHADGGDGTDRLVIGVGGSGAFAASGSPQTYVFSGNSATNAAIGLSTSTALIEKIVLDTTAAGGVGDTIDGASGTVALELLLGGGGDMVTGSSQADTIDAGGGDDNVNGGAGGDRIMGGDGADTLRGGLGSDMLDGGAGDDVVYGNTSDSDYFPAMDGGGNYLFGGSGADVLYGSGYLWSAGRLTDTTGEDDIGTEKDVLTGAGTFSVGAGDDATGTATTTDTLRLTLTGATSGVGIDIAAFNSTLWTVAGGEYRNFDRISAITGSNFADTFTVGNNVTTITYLYGGDGDDTLILSSGETGGGRILFQGGAGNDTVVFGSNTSHFVAGGDGIDTLDLRLTPSAPYSYAGFEIILGSGAADSFSGGVEDNEFHGFDGNDTLSGGGGNDILEGGDGDDTIYAGEGDDRIVGGAGADRMGGGAGVDTFVYRLVTDSTVGASDRLLDFQTGTDRIDLTAFRVGTITLVNAGPFATATIETDQGVIRIESDYQMALGDFMLDERMFTGTAGADSFAGGDFDDIFDMSQGGDDTVSGGSGNDAIFFGSSFTAADTVDGGAGDNDQIGLQGNYTGANALTLGVNTIRDVEVIGLLGGAGNGYSITTVDANVGAGQILTLFGTNLAAGNGFTFNGSAETDGAFRIYGGAGTDDLTGGGGNDGFWFGPGRFDPATDRVDGGGGNNDQLALDGDYTITLDGTAIRNVETITLQAGPAGDRNSFDITVADSLVGAGQQVTIFGLLAVNAIRIDATAELDGSVRVFGGQSHDTIYGSAGDDRLFGGNGSDFLYGGAGNDTYVYDAVSQSTGLQHDGIHLTAGDRIDFNFTVGGIAATVIGGTLSGDFDADLGAAIGAGQMGAGEAVLFRPGAGVYGGQSFLIVDANGVAGYQAGEDYVIQLLGRPTTLPPDPFI